MIGEEINEPKKTGHVDTAQDPAEPVRESCSKICTKNLEVFPGRRKSYRTPSSLS